MSTTPVTFDGVVRRPSISTRVRVGPRPRSSMLTWPVPGLLFCEPRPGTNCGIWLTSLSSVTEPVFSIALGPTDTIGLSAT